MKWLHDCLYCKPIIKLNGKQLNAKISKNYSLTSSKLIIEYRIEIKELEKKIDLYFLPEMNFIGASYPYKTNGFMNGEKFVLNELLVKENCSSFEIRDENEIEMVSIIIHLPPKVACITFPLTSYPKSELGIEEQYQGTAILPFIPINGKISTFQIEINLKCLK